MSKTTLDPVYCAWPCSPERAELLARLTQAERERDELAAEVERLRAGIDDIDGLAKEDCKRMTDAMRERDEARNGTRRSPRRGGEVARRGSEAQIRAPLGHRIGTGGERRMTRRQTLTALLWLALLSAAAVSQVVGWRM